MSCPHCLNSGFDIPSETRARNYFTQAMDIGIQADTNWKDNFFRSSGYQSITKPTWRYWSSKTGGKTSQAVELSPSIILLEFVELKLSLWEASCPITFSICACLFFFMYIFEWWSSSSGKGWDSQWVRVLLLSTRGAILTVTEDVSIQHDWRGEWWWCKHFNLKERSFKENWYQALL